MRLLLVFSILLYLVCVGSLGVPLIKGDPSKIGTLEEDEQGAMDPKDASLLKACAEGDIELVKKYLAAGANIEARDYKVGNTALIWASTNGHVHVIHFLLKKGAHIEAVSDDGHKTAILLASYYGHYDAVVHLLQQGARIDHANSRGDTSLSIASYMNHTTIVQALLMRRADITIKTRKHNYTPLHMAAHKGNIQILDNLMMDGLGASAIINAPDFEGNSPFMLAATNGRTEAVRYMLEQAEEFRIDLHMQEKKTGNTALMLAVTNAHEDTVEALLQDERVLSSINSQNRRKHSALMIAASTCKLKIIRLLLTKEGINTELQDKKGKNAQQIAKHMKCKSAVELFNEYYRLVGGGHGSKRNDDNNEQPEVAYRLGDTEPRVQRRKPKVQQKEQMEEPAEAEL